MLHRITVLLFCVCFMLCLPSAAHPQGSQVRVASPSGEVEFALSNEPAVAGGPQVLRYRVAFRGRPILQESELGLDIQGQAPLGMNLKQLAATTGSADETYRIPVGKANPVRNHYNGLRVDLAEVGGAGREFSIEVRAFDDGVAFRYLVPSQGPLEYLSITRERTQFRFATDAEAYPLVLSGFISSYEDDYQRRTIRSLHPDWLVALPLLAELPGTAWIAVTEANIDNYAGMYLRHSNPDANTLDAELSPRLDIPGVAVITTTPMQTPWRVLMIADDPGRLVESNIVLNLNPASAIGDASWIKAGKTAWNWWSGDVAKDVRFTPGMNTDTMKHYIDFASESGFAYMLIDAGWAAPLEKGTTEGIIRMSDITRTAPSIDMPEILRHAKEKNVRIWLWAHWSEIERYMDVAFPLYEKWGVAGVKIDFMNRDDQWMTEFYRRVTKKAAEHHLMVDFHGAYKPDGLRRTYPNLLTREGVMGLEYSKWSSRITPAHNTVLPFTRMLAGPMDYTPGGFLNVTRNDFVPRFIEPMVMGTRAHQLALYVVFESPLQMVSDFPERYREQKEFAFIRQVPTTWDETRVLSGRPAEFIVLARRSGQDWFIGGITNWDERDVEVALSFLGSGKYAAEIYRDAPDAGPSPTHTTIEERPVNSMSKLKIHLASGGGCAIWIHAATAR